MLIDFFTVLFKICTFLLILFLSSLAILHIHSDGTIKSCLIQIDSSFNPYKYSLIGLRDYRSDVQMGSYESFLHAKTIADSFDCRLNARFNNVN